MAKTLGKLKKEKVVYPEDLIETMREYVDLSAKIHAKIVIELINRAELTREEKQLLRDIALEGANLSVKQAREYEKVADFLV
ncbi:MAG: hypothetical protein WCV55_03140 [Candidatus Paceibacterota bacterium]